MKYPEKMTDNDHLHLLIVGTVGSPITGTTVSLEHLLNGLRGSVGVSVSVVNTAGIRGTSLVRIAIGFTKVLWQLWSKTRSSDVLSLHLAETALPSLLPAAHLVASLNRKPLVVRVFGGRGYRGLSGWKRAWVRFFLKRADLYLGQTRELVHQARRDGFRCVRWYPTNRPHNVSQENREKRLLAKRYIFISRLVLDKGIPELLEAAKRLPNDCHVDVYGPFGQGVTKELFDSHPRVTYRGIVKPEKVPPLLVEYDALVFPTYFADEGYPGVVIEALQAGIPIISTHWKAIPDLVDDTCGILVAPRDANALAQAMLRLGTDPVLYTALCQGSVRRQEAFSTDTWTRNFIDYCKALSDGAPVPKHTCEQTVFSSTSQTVS